MTMRVLRMCLGLLCVVHVAGCSSSGGSSGEDDKGKTTEVIGIDPLSYKCEYLATVEQVAEAIGGKVEQRETAFTPEPGTAEQCAYLRTGEEGKQEAWSFDLDCRADAMKTADTLFKQYEKTRMNDAGAFTNETGLVQIGRRAMDHHGQALIVVDDDTDCYLRVMGPGAEGRLALGKLLVDKLVWKIAPIRPRPAE